MLPSSTGGTGRASTCSIFPKDRARVLAIVTITDEDSFETVLEAAAPIVNSIEFHAP